jgi:hypothetical protein
MGSNNEQNLDILKIFKNLSKNKENLDNISFFVLVRDKIKKDYKLWDIDFDSNLRGIILQNLNEQLNDNMFTLTIAFEPINKTVDDHVEIINKNEVSNLEDILNDIKGSDLEEFDYKNESYEVWAFISVITLDEMDDFGFHKQIISFQKARKIELVKEKRFLSIFQKQGTYKNLENNKNILNIDKKMDCILYEENLLIFNHYNFELLFRFLQKYKNSIKSKLENLELDDKIINYEKLYDEIENNPNCLKKLYSAIKNNRLDKINTEKIHSLKEGGYVNIEMHNGKAVIDYKNVKKIIKVLEQDYVKDALSDDKFVTNPSGGKSKIED